MQGNGFAGYKASGTCVGGGGGGGEGEDSGLGVSSQLKV